jgi:hypothetical protein
MFLNNERTNKLIWKKIDHVAFFGKILMQILTQ